MFAFSHPIVPRIHTFSGAPGKTVVFGMLERQGDVMTKVDPNVKRATIQPHIVTNVAKGAAVSTDELLAALWA